MSIRPRPSTSLLAAVLAVLVSASFAAAEDEKEEPVVAAGRRVSIEYTLTLEDGTTADSNVGGDPLQFTVGVEQILPALESALEGLKVNETRNVVLSPAQGYGEVDPARLERVPIDKIPEDARFAGAMLIASDPSGRQRPVRIKEVDEDVVIVDLNHPLAGRTLTFDVRILSIE